MRGIKILLLIFLSLAFVAMRANPSKKESNQIYISGEFKEKDAGNDSLQISFWADYIYGAGRGGAKEFTAYIDRDGRFKITLPAVSHPGRLSVANYSLGIVLFEWQLVEPGDDINIVIEKEGSRITGRGAAKYNIKMQSSVSIRSDNVELGLLKTDSIIGNNLALLTHEKNNISNLAYDILQSDIIGEAYSNLLWSISYKDSATQSEWKEPVSGFANRDFLKIIESIPGHTLSMSTGYIKYTFAKSKMDVVLSGSPLTFTALFHHIYSSYNGIIREKLLTYLFADSPEILGFSGINADTFTTYLRTTLKMVQTVYLKKALRRQINAIGKNATGFDFRLRDSSGHYINLHDFRGKAVLGDIWATECGGCREF
ncbi:MAG: hypothetical protein NVS3B19_20020 [Ginsengibacter sp.]